MVNSIERLGQYAILPVLVLTCLMAACEGEETSPPATAEVDTIGGVVVVRNGAGLWRKSERWQVVEAFRAGGSVVGGSPDEELIHATNVGVILGPNGQIFVFEYATDRVLVFQGDGKFLRAFGGTGEGPGELRGPMAMAWDGTNHLWVADTRGRYHVFDSAGAFEKSVRRPSYGLRRIVHPLLWETAGTLIEEAGDDDGVLFVRIDTLGSVVDTAAAISTRDPFEGFQNRMMRPSWNSARFVFRHYVRDPRWSLAPDGTFWSAQSDQLRLVQTTSGGDTIRIVETSHRTAEFDRRDRARIAEGLKEAGVDRGAIELVRPVVGGIHVMDDGHILVEIIEVVGDDPGTFDVFNPDGYYLGSVNLGFTLPDRNLPALVGDTILAVTPGTLGVPYLVRATIRRPR